MELELIEERYNDSIIEIDKYIELILNKFDIKTHSELNSIGNYIKEVEEFIGSCNSENDKYLSVVQMKDLLYSINIDYYRSLESQSSDLSASIRIEYKNTAEKNIVGLLYDHFYKDFEIFNFSVNNELEIYNHIESHLGEFRDIVIQNEMSYCGHSIINEFDELIKQPNEILDKITKLIRKEFANDYSNELAFCIHDLEEISDVYSIVDSDKITNLYKQSFILLMANLDAVLFDISKQLLISKFFKFAEVFSDKKNGINLTTSKFGAYEDFEDFRNKIIEEILNQKYAKGIIQVLHDNTDLLNDQKKFKRLVEIFDRRNIHLHNNGIVDSGYCVGRSLFSLRDGDHARIDDSYYEYVKTISVEFIGKLIAWAKNEIV